ncbi:16S rRNA (uracil(1498)-N(3))-methyltransferase [Aestuariibacter salexigens]|uniref:16S rRNA (uracil(1498)-N(3))-methyltransferase n=1 Tax=Aestuariibacter salexigens TaxID=226010 RepID=UPI0004795047|nr:16S rRNA (uracil(1498)-N(3))-methyltransferase [Aestuariibacter salexigens]
MRIPRIYHSQLLSSDSQIALEKDAVNHVVNVLRLKPGHPVVLFNGDGNEYSGSLVHTDKRSATVNIDAKLSLSVESSLSIHLAQGVSKGDRMDWAIQKAVELGVNDITPVITERCAVKLPPERWEKKRGQWQKIAIGACEQSGRNVVPDIHPVISVSEWMQQSTNQLRLILQPKSTHRLRQLSLPTGGVRLLIGPEGGLSDQEMYSAEQCGFHGVDLGPRILRTETAAVAAIATLQAMYGDL